MTEKLRSITRTKGPAVLAFALLIGIWQGVCSLGLVPSFMLPSPVDVVKAFAADFSLLMENTAVTLQEAFLGLLLGVLLGFFFAVLMDAFAPLRKALYPILAETMAKHHNFELVSGDILKTDIPALVREKFDGLDAIACANLPYNITTPAITALLEAGCFSAVTVMIQREVARRICAAPGTADYGAFSLYCQYHANCELLFDVPPECFIPAPKVTSSVLRMVPRPAPAEVDDPEHFFKVVKAAFAQRRKTLLNGLTTAFGSRLSKEELADVLCVCGLPADIRGERLGIPEFARLSKELRRRI